MKKVLIPVLALTLAVASCSKNDTAPENGGNSTKLLSRTEDTNGDVEIFSYDASGKFLSIADSNSYRIQADSAVYKNGILTNIYRQSSTGMPGITHNFVFDANNRLAKIVFVSSGQIWKIDSLVYNSAGTLSSFYNLRPEANGTYTIVASNDITVDANGNLATMTVKELGGAGTLVLKRKDVYSYDNHRNPYSRIASPAFWIVREDYYAASTNNITRVEEYHYPNGTPVLDELDTNKYTYDADGDIIAVEHYEGTTDADLKLDYKSVLKYIAK